MAMSFLPIQKQDDGFNCNAFAITYDTNILKKKNTFFLLMFIFVIAYFKVMTIFYHN